MSRGSRSWFALPVGHFGVNNPTVPHLHEVFVSYLAHLGIIVNVHEEDNDGNGDIKIWHEKTATPSFAK